MQTFRAVHRHDAHLVTLLLHVALDLDVARAELIDEALQRRRGLAVISERDVEKLVDRFGRLGSKPRQHRLAQALPVGAEQLGEEFVRRQDVGARQPGRERLDRRGEASIILRLGLQRRPQRASRSIGEREQVVVVEAEERALEHDGEREIVIGHQEEIGQCDEVLHRELVGELHAVGARHRHVEPLQLADHRRGEGIAAPHQDQNIAGAHLAAFGRKRLAVVEPAFDHGGDALAELIDRARAGRLLVPGLEGGGLIGLLLGLDLPQLDQTRFAFPEGVVLDDRARLPGQPVGGRRPVRTRCRPPRGSARSSGTRG